MLVCQEYLHTGKNNSIDQKSETGDSKEHPPRRCVSLGLHHILRYWGQHLKIKRFYIFTKQKGKTRTEFQFHWNTDWRPGNRRFILPSGIWSELSGTCPFGQALSCAVCCSPHISHRYKCVYTYLSHSLQVLGLDPVANFLVPFQVQLKQVE